MLGWKCLSTKCAAVRMTTESDVVAFVAEMEQCDIETAAILIIDGLLSKTSSSE
jgi:ribosomal protein S12